MSMRLGWGKAIVAAAAGVFAMSLASGQTVEEGKRKTKSTNTPVYPELARRMNISGRVRIEVVIAPDGRVKSARPMGGHPLLVQSCMDAVKQWKYEAAPEETTQVVEFNFKE